MQHSILLILFIWLLCSLSIASPPSERHLGFGFDDTFGPEAFPVGFDDRATDVAECATCVKKQSEPSIAAKPEMRKELLLGEATRTGEGQEPGTDVKLSMQKQRRQVLPDANADWTATEPASNPQPVTPGNYPGQHAQSGVGCKWKNKSDCNLARCKADGGGCKVVELGNGKEGCRQARRLENGILELDERFTQLPSCHRCQCQLIYFGKKFTAEDCLMVGRSLQNCPKSQAQRCHNAGARCVVGEHRNRSACVGHIAETNAQLRGEQPSNPWKTEACEGCFCTRQRHYRAHGWNGVELSRNGLSTGLNALWYAAEALSPTSRGKRKKTSLD